MPNPPMMVISIILLLFAQAVFSVEYDEVLIQHQSSGKCLAPLAGALNDTQTIDLVFKKRCEPSPQNTFSLLPNGLIQHVASGRCARPDSRPNSVINKTNVVLTPNCERKAFSFSSTNKGAIQHDRSGFCFHPLEGKNNPRNKSALVLKKSCGKPWTRFSYLPTIADQDDDGIADEIDQCPETPTDLPVGEFGCALSQLDSDNDLINDDEDQCPDQQGPLKTGGCASLFNDFDADGIQDPFDRCPFTKIRDNVLSDGCSGNDALDDDIDGVANGIDLCLFTDAAIGEVSVDGCTGNQLSDSDQDQIIDGEDLCPIEFGNIGLNGCSMFPSTFDNDGDGVLNVFDLCPYSAEAISMLFPVTIEGCFEDFVVQDFFDDFDGDGVFNFEDSCESTPIGQAVNEAGCTSSQIDTDSDGVNDQIDQCPDTEFGPPIDEVGCPLPEPDEDEDGLVDRLDICPNTPFGESVNFEGCSLSQLDSDDDGLSDRDELEVFFTDPNNDDSDFDGFPDGLEVRRSTDPLNADSIPASISSFFETFEGTENNFGQTPASSDATWFLDNTLPFEGNQSLRSGDIEDNQLSTIQLEEVFPAGVLSFYVRVESESCCDQLTFFVNDIQVFGSASEQWSFFQIALEEGVNTLRWTYLKDGSVSNGSDSAWIDNISFIAGAELDSDNDGVVDSIDICPDTPLNTLVDDSGCPLLSGDAPQILGQPTINLDNFPIIRVSVFDLALNTTPSTDWRINMLPASLAIPLNPGSSDVLEIILLSSTPDENVNISITVTDSLGRTSNVFELNTLPSMTSSSSSFSSTSSSMPTSNSSESSSSSLSSTSHSIIFSSSSIRFSSSSTTSSSPPQGSSSSNIASACENDVLEGGVIYQAQGCVLCHDAVPTGGGSTSWRGVIGSIDLYDDQGDGYSPGDGTSNVDVSLAEYIRLFMPFGNSNLLTEEEASRLAAYMTHTVNVARNWCPGDLWPPQSSSSSISSNSSSSIDSQQEPPLVNGPQVADFFTGDNQIIIDLVASPAITDINGDFLTADLSTLTPVGDAPNFEFPLSEGNKLIIDPVEFYTHTNQFQPTTFAYSYIVSDSAGGSAEAIVELSVTQSEQPNLLANGSFENALDGWNIFGLVDISQSDQPEFRGQSAARLISTDAGINQGLSNLEAGSNYIFQARQKRESAFTAGFAQVMDSEENILFSADWFFQGGAGAQLHALHFTSENADSITYQSNGIASADDLKIFKYPSEAVNNLIPTDSATFDEGNGQWNLGSGASIINLNTNESAGMSLHSGLEADAIHMLTLGLGAIENGKRYLITMDLSIENFDPSSLKAFSVSIRDETDFTVATYGDINEAVLWTGDNASQRFAVLIDVNDSIVIDWNSREVALVIGTNVYGQGKNHIIDNISLVEVP